MRLGDIVSGAGRVAAGVGSAGLSEALIFGPAEASERRNAEMHKQLAEERRKKKQNQLAILGQLKAPEYSPQFQARIKALEEESRHTSLVEDPYFQKERSNLVQGGQQALSSVQNEQRAQGTTGGFSNQGSIADIYDRLSGQLSGLGQKSNELKDRKAGAAADMHQSMVEAQIEYENAVTRARMSIESGDSDSAMAAIQQAYDAQEKIEARKQQMIGSIIGAGATVGGAALGGPAGAKAGNKVGGGVQDASADTSDYSGSSSAARFQFSDPNASTEDYWSKNPYETTASRPYAATRKTRV